MKGTLGRGVGRRTAAETDATEMGEKESEAAAGVAEVVGAADAGVPARSEKYAVDVVGAVGVAAGAGEVGGAGGGLRAAWLKQIGAHTCSSSRKRLKVERRRLSMDLANENEELR